MARVLLAIPIRRLVSPLVSRGGSRRPYRSRPGAMVPRPGTGTPLPDLVEGQELREYVAHHDPLEQVRSRVPEV